jgi:hypothetical protein
MRNTMKKRYWRDAIWFAAGTFLGGMVLGFIGNIFKKV